MRLGVGKLLGCSGRHGAVSLGRNRHRTSSEQRMVLGKIRQPEGEMRCGDRGERRMERSRFIERGHCEELLRNYGELIARN